MNPQPDALAVCPKCESGSQVWVNQITRKVTCHRVGCHNNGGLEVETHCGPHYVIVGYNEAGQPCAAMTVFAASAGLGVVRENAASMLQDAGHEHVKTADAVPWQPKPKCPIDAPRGRHGK